MISRISFLLLSLFAGAQLAAVSGAPRKPGDGVEATDGNMDYSDSYESLPVRKMLGARHDWEDGFNPSGGPKRRMLGAHESPHWWHMEADPLAANPPFETLEADESSEDKGLHDSLEEQFGSVGDKTDKTHRLRKMLSAVDKTSPQFEVLGDDDSENPKDKWHCRGCEDY